MEYLVGRSLQNAIINLGLEENFSAAMANLGYVLEDLYEQEADAGLGYSGLGRLAACFMDSMATMDYPAWGYGLRYKYGMFYQKIKNGGQMEYPDYWLENGNPWEVERLDIMYPIHFYGYCKSEIIDGKIHNVWYPKQKVLAIAYDTPIPGYSTYNTLNLRLWSAQASKEFDLDQFNSGDLYDSIGDRGHAERITAVLYPNDSSPGGKELRLKQQYFMVSATIQDLLRRFRESKRQFSELPESIAIQLNDSHPTLAAIELLRILLDVEGLSYEDGYKIIASTFSFTNHAVNKVNLEKWSVEMMSRVLPRHMQLIYEINHHFLQTVERKWPNDQGKMTHMSIIEEGQDRMIRMSYLAIVICHHVNGVAEIHSEIIRTEVTHSIE
jgi:glycogen phosphorylase